MTDFSPRWLIVPATAALVAAALLVSPGPGTIGGEEAAYSDPDQDAVLRDLEARRTTVMARITYKEELIDRLIDGQATLEEVSDEFLRLNRDTPALVIIRSLYPGSGDEEKSARNVIEFVRSRMLPTARNADVMDRLQREFEQTYGHPCATGG
jgi:hypothetical protein